MVDKKITHTYLVLIAITLVALYVIQRFDISYPITLRTSQVSSELSVVGEGKLDIVPDTATVDVGITVTNAKTAPDAQKQIDDVNNKIIEAMKTIGVQKQNIQTLNYSIYPNTNYDETTKRDSINGYNGSVTVSIKTNDVSLSSKIVDTATKSGANQIQGIRFSIDHPEVYREKVRDLAIANARTQAEKLAKNLGLKLGKVTNIVESSSDGGQPIPMIYAEKAMGGGGGGPQVEPGTQTISSIVTLSFEKK